MTILVILCSRNGEKYLHAQILSILKQTEPGVRLLISDDVSTDSTARIARDYQELYPDRVQFVQRTEPSGGAARHFMSVLHSFGTDADYILFADQDDVWHPEKVKETLRIMLAAEEKYGADTPLLVHCDMRVTDETGNVISDSYVRYQQMSPQRNGLNRLLVQNNVTGGAMMMNRALARILRRHPVPEHPVMHDHWIALTAAAFGKIIFLDKALYDYRQHGDNVLGAAKGSRIREVLDRLGLFRKDGKTKEEMDRYSSGVYTALFRQAAEFGRQYGKELSPKQVKLLQAFVSLRKMNRAQKIFTILKYGFTFNRLHRTVGECMFL